MSRRILFFASDPAERESLLADLAAGEAGWEKLVVGSFDEAVAAIQSQPVDAIVVNHEASDPSSAKLINWAAEHCPKAARLILAEPAEREEVLRTVLAPHQFLPKPVAADVLKGTIQSAHLLGNALPNEVLLTLASRIRVFPPIPSLYFRVLNELKSPDFSAQAVGEIVAKDLAMTTRLLQVINSGFYSLPRRITDLTEAVSLLGQETVKSLVIGIHLFLEHEHLKPLYFSISQLWRHSTSVAQGAWMIAQMETGNADRTEEAYTAGLLHDIGKLVLANNFEAQYNKVQRAARSGLIPLWQAETEEFGVSHAELGAFILGRWGMPVGLLEATALHHQPGRCGSQEFSALTAVHVANALEYELQSPQEGNIPATLDNSYLESLGLLDRIDGWRECLRNGKVPANRKPGSKTVAQGAAASPSIVSSHVAPLDAARPVRSTPHKAKWLTATAAAVVLASLGWYLGRHWPAQEPIPARAKSRPGAGGSTGTAPEDLNPVNRPDATTGTNSASSMLENPAAPASPVAQPADPSNPAEAK